MDILYQRSPASVSEVRDLMSDAPSYSSVRALLCILENKGHITHQRTGARYLYLPATPRSDAARTALAGVLHTFFGGSAEKVVATLISGEESRLTTAELDRLAELIAEARAKELER